ncbi:MAG: nicotinamide riboside transporter PnuC [Lachnospirales bacterium]
MLKKLKENPIKCLNKFDKILWFTSVLIIFLATYMTKDFTFATLFAPLVGVTSLLFVAKGNVYGHIFGILFAILYGYISFGFKYYGEAITYLCMSAPMGLFALISWLKNPYEDTQEVKVSSVSKKKLVVIFLLTTIITIIFYFILKAFNTSNLNVSTVSIATSFFAVSLSFLRSPYYAIAYVLNDLILIVLWIYASFTDLQYVNMVICFIVFIVNDIYGYISWQSMKNRQNV